MIDINQNQNPGLIVIPNIAIAQPKTLTTPIHIRITINISKKGL